MKSKNLYQRDSNYFFKKSQASRCGILCCTLMFCFGMTVFREGNFVGFFLDNRWGMAILGQDVPDHEIFRCDRSNRQTDVCLLRGDVHVITGNSSSVVLLSRSCEKISSAGRVEFIRPYTRKWETQTMESVHPVALTCKGMNSKERILDYGRNADTSCDPKNMHSVPAVLFSSGGFTGNPYHDFQDVLIPLFIVSQHLKGEVVFVISDIRPWWVKRWRRVLHQLSRYPIVDLKKESGQYCFPEVMIGLYIHREFGVNPSLMLNGESMEDFQNLLYAALASPRLKENMASHTQIHNSQKQETRIPTLLIVARKDTRAFNNEKELVKLATELKFKVKVVTLSDKIDLQIIYGWFYSSDVVMGVHGAELAHIMFMRRKSVVVQVVPLGTDWPSHHYFAGPAVRDLGLQYMEYKIKPEESSLSEKYGLWHPIVRNPAHYVSKGWATQKQLYLTEQNVSPNPNTMRKTLLKARSSVLSAFP